MHSKFMFNVKCFNVIINHHSMYSQIRSISMDFLFIKCEYCHSNIDEKLPLKTKNRSKRQESIILKIFILNFILFEILKANNIKKKKSCLVQPPTQWMIGSKKKNVRKIRYSKYFTIHRIYSRKKKNIFLFS